MESRLEGDLDLQRFLGIRDDVPRGYKEIRMVVDIDADGSPEELEEIVKLGPTYSLVLRPKSPDIFIGNLTSYAAFSISGQM